MPVCPLASLYYSVAGPGHALGDALSVLAFSWSNGDAPPCPSEAAKLESGLSCLARGSKPGNFSAIAGKSSSLDIPQSTHESLPIDFHDYGDLVLIIVMDCGWAGKSSVLERYHPYQGSHPPSVSHVTGL